MTTYRDREKMGKKLVSWVGGFPAIWM